VLANGGSSRVNPNDEIRRRILKYFYDRNASATSRKGKKGSAVKISDAKRELKAQHGLTQQQVMANLTYLISNDWIATSDVEKTFSVKGGTVPSTTTFYEITARGIDKIEGGSQFEPTDRYAGINITATGSNTITLGDGNVVNADYRVLHSELDGLKHAVAASGGLSEAQKLDLAADIETMKDQLAKPKPNVGVLRQLWSGLNSLATLDGVAGAYDRARALVVAVLESTSGGPM
jgi:hypothetical protein